MSSNMSRKDYGNRSESCALMEIRDKGLYRDVLGYQTFEEYCRVKWDMKRTYAYYMIESAKVVENVHHGEQIPMTESQTRPLARLDPEKQKEAWQMAVETAPDGKVTADHRGGLASLGSIKP